MAELNVDNRGAPPHAMMHESPARTDYTVRFGLTLLPARYALRSIFRSITDSSSPESLRKVTGDPIRDRFFANPLFKQIDDHFATLDKNAILGGSALPASDLAAQDKLNKILKTGEGKQLREFVRNKLGPWGAGGLVDNTLHYAFITGDESKPGKVALTDFSKSRIRSAMAAPMFEYFYDNSLGVGSLWMTYILRNKVLHDIQSVYKESVAYELGKDASQVNDDDIFASNNEIIQATVHNYQSKLTQRLAISALPFLKNIPAIRALQFGDAAIGAWGIFWAYDTWGREPTMLELFSDFVNDKLSPKFGIGDPIKPSDIINLYQHYSLKFKPDWAFTNVATSDISEDKLWLQSEGIFREIATLMNESYNYKHKSSIDPDTGLPVQTANFQLPKFIYLLGHGLINIHKPDWSMAFVKIANEYGMDAVKEVERAFKRDMDLESILKKYPVSLDHKIGADREAKIVKDKDYTEPKPDIVPAEKTDVLNVPVLPEQHVLANSVHASHMVPPQTVALAPHSA